MIKEPTPQALALEIEKHERFLAVVDSGLAKLGKTARRNREKYIAQLKTQLLDATKPDVDCEMSDDDLLAELGL